MMPIPTCERFRIATLAALLVLVAPTPAVADEAAAIRGVFDGYRNALLDRRGRDAVRFIHPRSLRYFVRVRELAVTASAGEVQGFSVFDQLMVLFMRVEFGERTLASMTVEDVFAIAVDRGLVGNNLHRLGVGDVRISGTKAEGVATRDGQATPLHFWFRRAGDGSWRLDLANLMLLGDRMMEAMRVRQGTSKRDFVLTLLRAVAQQPIPDDIWDARPDR